MNKLIFIVLLISTPSYAGFFDGKLDLYHCSSVEQAHSCVKCEKVTIKTHSMKLEKGFEVDKSNNSVFQKVYKNDTLADSHFLEGCKVLDTKNWVCETQTQSRNKNGDLLSQKYMHKMTNGIYVNYSEYSKNFDIDTPRSAICAK